MSERSNEMCWQIPDRIRRELESTPRGWSPIYSMIGDPPQGTVAGQRICFPEMHLSYEDYTLLGDLLDREGRHHFLSGRVGGTYSYETGEAEYWFPSADDAQGHYDALVEKGFLHSAGPEAVSRPGI